MPTVLVCDPYHPDGLKKLREHGFVVDERPKISAEELAKLAGNYDALMVRSRTKVTKDLLQASNRIKAVARALSIYGSANARKKSPIEAIDSSSFIIL